jgi:hypothetical protein
MFDLKVDEEIRLRSIHPNDSEAFFFLSSNGIAPAFVRELIQVSNLRLPKPRDYLLQTVSPGITEIRLAPVSLSIFS